MYYKWTFIFSLIYLNPIVVADDQNEYLNDESWVNPFDMINYDRASKSMLKSSLGVTSAQNNRDDIDLLMSEVKSLKNEVEQCKTAFANCSRHISSVRNEADTSMASSSTLHPPAEQAKRSSNKIQECERNRYFMRRFVNLFLKAGHLVAEMPPSLETFVEVKISVEQLAILQQFGKGSSEISLQELDDVFSNILIGSTANPTVLEYFDNFAWFKPENIAISKETLLICFLVFLPVICLWKLFRGHKIISIIPIIMFAIFITSFSITYYKMLKEAEINQYNAMQKNLERQKECRSTSELSWFAFLRLPLSHGGGDCEEMQRKAMLEPFLQVTPALVLSQMLSESLLLQPAASFGAAIAEFSKPILGRLPFMTNYVVLFLSLCIIMMVLFLCIGGRISLPFFMGSVDMASGGTPAAAVNEAQAAPKTPSIQEHVDHRTVKSMIRKEVVRALSVGSAPLFQEKVVEIKHLPEPEEEVFETENEGEAHKPCCCGDSVHVQQLDHKICLDRNDVRQEIVLVRDAYSKGSLKGHKCLTCVKNDNSGKQQPAATSSCGCQCSSGKKHSVTYVRKKVKVLDVQRSKRDAEEELSSEISDESAET